MTKVILDTNIYISFFVDRNPDQRALARKYLKEMEKGRIAIILPSLILAEVIYILADYYNFERDKIAEALISLLSEENLIIEEKEVFLESLEMFQSTKLDFADCYIYSLSDYNKLKLVSFDKNSLKETKNSL